MTLAPGIHVVGPADGELLVLTYREGVAQKVGHDLILEATAWTATIEVGEPGLPGSVVLQADPRGLRVRQGLHGAKPLTDSDRASIRENIAKKVLGTQPVTFRSDRVMTASGRVAVTGELALRGKSRPVAFEVALEAGGRVTGRLTLRQSEWDIAPYRALMGALKVRDEVTVTVELALPAG